MVKDRIEIMGKMKVEEFYNQFEGLDSQVSQLGSEVQSARNTAKRLERILETKKFMQQVLAGLRSTPFQNDPGKYGPAFYFVAEIIPDYIREANEPSLYKPCPLCKTDLPVLMRYEQTYDSPDGDIWVKEAFIMCKEDGIHRIEHISRDYRFL
jgi:hypothetical protein